MDDYQFERVKHRKTTVEEICLEYSLLKTKCVLSGDTIYSVRIDATHNEITDFKLAFDISRDVNTAQNIFDCLARETVTPCTLFDVLEDIL